jgi:hypothetical protein
MLLLLGAVAASAAQVDSFSPQGEVRGARQVAVRFSEPMVAFGDPRLPEPFQIECPAPGAARWADQKNWVYDFAHDLPAGLRCSFRLKPDLVSLDGNRLDAAPPFEFSTGGPAVVQMMPYEGNRIDEEQIFLLGLDAPATEQSIVANAYCDIRGIMERVPVRVIVGDERTTLLAARRDFVDRFLTVLFKDGREIVIDSINSFPTTVAASFRSRCCNASAGCRTMRSSGWSGAKASPRRAALRPIRTRFSLTRCATPSRRALPATG